MVPHGMTLFAGQHRLVLQLRNVAVTPACGTLTRRRWLSEGRLTACGACGGPLDTKIERRQQFQGRFRTKREAQRALLEALGSVINGSHVTPNGVTLGHYLTNEWLPSRHPKGNGARGHRGQVALGTWAGYRDIANAYLVPRLGGVPLQELSPADLNRLYDDLEAVGGRGASRCRRRPC